MEPECKTRKLTIDENQALIDYNRGSIWDKKKKCWRQRQRAIGLDGFLLQDHQKLQRVNQALKSRIKTKVFKEKILPDRFTQLLEAYAKEMSSEDQEEVKDAFFDFSCTQS